jgi:hypothetical protein
MKTILFQPFERYPERSLIAVGLLSALLAVVAGTYFDVRFDGVLDLHFVPGASAKDLAVDLGVDFSVLFIFLFAAAKWVNRKTRAVDVLSAVLVAKIPMYPPMLLNAGGKLAAIGESVATQAKAHQPPSIDALGITLLVLFMILMLVFMVWSVALLYNGYKTAAHGKGAKAIILFIGALLLAEIASKIMLNFIETQWFK